VKEGSCDDRKQGTKAKKSPLPEKRPLLISRVLFVLVFFLFHIMAECENRTSTLNIISEKRRFDK